MGLPLNNPHGGMKWKIEKRNRKKREKKSWSNAHPRLLVHTYQNAT